MAATINRLAGPVCRRRQAPSRRRSGREALLGYALVTPIVVVMLLVIALPVVSAVTTSMQDQRVIGSPSSFVGFETYLDVLSDRAFWAALGRSGIWLIANMVVQAVLGFSTALLLQRSGWWSRTARTWVVLPWVVPTVAVAVMWQWMLNTNYGIVYKMLDAVGIDIGSPFGNPAVALGAVILVNSWHWFPLSAVVIYGALATVPTEVIEAAKVDGAGAWRTFTSITLPLIQPILFALGLVGSLWSFNILDSIYLITAGGPAGATTTMPVYVYDTAFSAFRTSRAAAASVLTVAVLVVLALVFARLARPKEEV